MQEHGFMGSDRVAGVGHLVALVLLPIMMEVAVAVLVAGCAAVLVAGRPAGGR